jgi:hypothetical protein
MSRFTDQDIRLALISARGNTEQAAEILSSGRFTKQKKKLKNTRLHRPRTEAEQLYSARGIPRYTKIEDDSSGEDGVDLVAPDPNEVGRDRDRDGDHDRNNFTTLRGNLQWENEQGARNQPYGMPAFGMPRFGGGGDSSGEDDVQFVESDNEDGF